MLNEFQQILAHKTACSYDQAVLGYRSKGCYQQDYIVRRLAVHGQVTVPKSLQNMGKPVTRQAKRFGAR